MMHTLERRQLGLAFCWTWVSLALTLLLLFLGAKLSLSLLTLEWEPWALTDTLLWLGSVGLCSYFLGELSEYFILHTRLERRWIYPLFVALVACLSRGMYWEGLGALAVGLAVLYTLLSVYQVSQATSRLFLLGCVLGALSLWYPLAILLLPLLWLLLPIVRAMSARNALAVLWGMLVMAWMLVPLWAYISGSLIPGSRSWEIPQVIVERFSDAWLGWGQVDCHYLLVGLAGVWLLALFAFRLTYYQEGVHLREQMSALFVWTAACLLFAWLTGKHGSCFLYLGVLGLSLVVVHALANLSGRLRLYLVYALLLCFPIIILLV